MSKSILAQLRRAAYTSGRLLGDVGAVKSGKPSKVAKRLGNKVIGRFVGKFWLR